MFRGVILCILLMCSLTALEEHWKPTYYVWSHAFSFTSDTPPKEIPLEWRVADYEHIKRGDIVWIPQGYFISFYRDIFPHIQEPFILVSNMADETFPTYFKGMFNLEEFINDFRIIHIFSQNCDLHHPKITQIPIGLDFHSWAYDWRKERGEYVTPEEQETILRKLLLRFKPTNERISRIFVDFQHHDTLKTSYNHLSEILGETRTSIFKQLCKTDLIDYNKNRLPRTELWKTKGKYAFSVSPPGNGWDAHRTWEDLVLGCIVIVKTSPLDPLYEGLPVVIVKDWSEITKKNLKRWQKQYGDAFANPEYRKRLTQEYWTKKVQEKQREYFLKTGAA